MKTMKRTLSLLLAFALLCGAMALPASAAVSEPHTAANALYELGLFQGVGNLPNGNPDFALDKSATRVEATVMLVKLLGAEQEAKSGRYKHTFTDVPSWASGYVGYAKAKNIVKGVSATKFDANSLVTSSQFVTMVLQAMGYSNVDYKNPFPVAKSVGLTYSNQTPFTRGDMAVVCLSALSCRPSGKTQTLGQQMVAEGKIQKMQMFHVDVIQKYSGFNATMAVEGDALANYYPGLSEIATKQRVIYTTMMSAAVCEIALVEVKNAADVQKVKDIFQARIDYQVGTDDAPGGAWYPATIEGWKNNSRIVDHGNYVMMIVWEKADQFVEQFNALF